MTTPICPTGKHPFTSRRAARQARRVLRSGDRLRTYRCPHCHAWHWTSGIGTSQRATHHTSRP